MSMKMWDSKTMPIGGIKQLLSDGYEVEIDSADGFVPVTEFVDKGNYEEYLVRVRDRVLRVNADHLFETPDGWKRTHDLWHSQDTTGHRSLLLMDDGEYWVPSITRTGVTIPIVDVQIDHPNHRYYADGVSSHNTNVGKSLTLIHVSAACLRQSKNVLYISMEMAEERVAERIDANMMNIPIDDVNALSRSDYIRKIQHIRATSTGRLIIKEYPTGSANVSHFRALLQELKLKQNFTPDIIMVDYLSICGSARVKMGSNINSYTLYKFVAEELRGLAVEYNVPVFTAAQFNRQGYGSSDPSIDNVGESWAIPQTADFMFALVSTEALEKLGQISLQPMKNRFAARNSFQHHTLGIDTARQKIYDLTGQALVNALSAANGPATQTSSKPSFPSFAGRKRRPLSSFNANDEDSE